VTVARAEYRARDAYFALYVLGDPGELVYSQRHDDFCRGDSVDVGGDGTGAVW
jgi:hypothetical protein